MGWIDQVTEQHHIIAHTRQNDVVWRESAQNSLEIVDILRKRRIGKSFAQAGLFEASFETRMLGDSKAKIASWVWRWRCREWSHGIRSHPEEGHILGGLRLSFTRFAVRFDRNLLRDRTRILSKEDGQSARKTGVRIDSASVTEELSDLS